MKVDIGLWGWMDPPCSKCACVFLGVCDGWTDRQRGGKKADFCLCYKGGRPFFSDSSSQVQDVLSGIVRKHIWQGQVAMLLWRASTPSQVPQLHILSKHWRDLQRPVSFATPAGTVCRKCLEMIRLCCIYFEALSWWILWTISLAFGWFYSVIFVWSLSVKYEAGPCHQTLVEVTQEMCSTVIPKEKSLVTCPQ